MYICSTIKSNKDKLSQNKLKETIMGAKKLQPVEIMCELSQSQIEEVVNYVYSTLPVMLDELSDFDEPMFNNSARVCVDWDVDGLGNLEIKSAEILDRDWDVLEADSFAFSHFLKPMIADYNNHSRESKRQSKQILRDRREYVPCV